MKYRRYRDSLDDRKLGRDPFHRKLGGVCAGLARYLGVETIYIRIAAIIALFIAPQFTLIAYGIAYLVLDDRLY